MKNDIPDTQNDNFHPHSELSDSFPVKSAHITRLRHPTPPWWPRSAEKRLILGQRVCASIASVAEDLAYNISPGLVEDIREAVAILAELRAWRQSLRALGRQYTNISTYAYNGPANGGGVDAPVILQLDESAVVTLGPVGASRVVRNGLLGLLVQLEAELRTVPAYCAHANYGIKLGFVTAAPAKPNLEKIVFEFLGFTLINGKPAVKWRKHAHYVDGGIVEYRDVGGEDSHWRSAGMVVRNPGALDIPRLALPRRVELQGRYVKNNEQRGNWSSIYRVDLPGL
jgi:hypothetical protein